MLDNGAGDDIVNPDSLGLNDQALLIQEDRNKAATGVARIHDVRPGERDAHARCAALDPSDAAIERGGGPGVWESSGVVDVERLLRPGQWLVNVQAHQTKIRQQGLDLKVDSGVGERGQLLLVKIRDVEELQSKRWRESSTEECGSGPRRCPAFFAEIEHEQ